MNGNAEPNTLQAENDTLEPYASIYVGGYQQLAGWNGRLMLKRLSEANGGIIGRLVIKMRNDWERICKKMHLHSLWSGVLDQLTITELPKVLAYDQPLLSSIFSQFPNILNLLLQHYLGILDGEESPDKDIERLEKEIERLRLQQTIAVTQHDIVTLEESITRLNQELSELRAIIAAWVQQLDIETDETERERIRVDTKQRENEQFKKEIEKSEVEISILRHQQKLTRLNGELEALQEEDCDVKGQYISVDYFIELLNDEICKFMLAMRMEQELDFFEEGLGGLNQSLNKTQATAARHALENSLDDAWDNLLAGSGVSPKDYIRTIPWLTATEKSLVSSTNTDILPHLTVLLRTNIISNQMLRELRKAAIPNLVTTVNLTVNNIMRDFDNKVAWQRKQKLVLPGSEITENEIQTFKQLPASSVMEFLKKSGCSTCEGIDFKKIKMTQSVGRKTSHSITVSEIVQDELLIVSDREFKFDVRMPIIPEDPYDSRTTKHVHFRGDIQSTFKGNKSFSLPRLPDGFILGAIASSEFFEAKTKDNNDVNQRVQFFYKVLPISKNSDQTQFSIEYDLLFDGGEVDSEISEEFTINIKPNFYYVQGSEIENYAFSFEDILLERINQLKTPRGINLQYPMDGYFLKAVVPTKYQKKSSYSDKEGFDRLPLMHDVSSPSKWTGPFYNYFRANPAIRIDDADEARFFLEFLDLSGNFNNEEDSFSIQPLLIYKSQNSRVQIGDECYYDPTLVRLILYKILLKIPMIKNAVQSALNEAFRPLEKYYQAIAVSALSDEEAKFATSPIALLDIYKQHFYDCGTFLGPAIDHVWAAANSKVEHVEIISLTEHMSRETETYVESEVTKETSKSTKSDFLDEIQQERESNFSFGQTLDVSGGIGIINASSSTTFDFAQRTQNSHKQTTNKTEEQSSRVSNRMKKTSRTTNFRSITRSNQNTKRHLIDNTGKPTSNYEIRRKYQRIGIALEWVGCRLCWQFYVDDPASLLAKSELVHFAGSQDLYDLPELVQEEIPTEEIVITDQEFYIPFVQTHGDDTRRVYINGRDGDEEILNIFSDLEVSNMPEGYVIKSVQMHGKARGEGRMSEEDEPKNPNVFEYVVKPEDINASGKKFTLTLTKADFNDAAGVFIQPKITIKPDQALAAKIAEANNKRKSEYEAEKQRLLKLDMERKRKERIEAERSIQPRDSQELRNEERYAIFRALSVKFADNAEGDLKQVSELFSTLFDLDRMMYFVAPDWWKPKFHGTRQRANKPERASPIYGKRFQLDDYDITPDSEPAPYGSSLGWMLQLDGDDQRNSFLNSSWVKVVLPINPGMAFRAKKWLMQDNIEGSDIEQDLLDLLIQAEEFEVDESSDITRKLTFSEFGTPPNFSFEPPDESTWKKIVKTWVEIVPTKQTVAVDVEYENRHGMLMPKETTAESQDSNSEENAIGNESVIPI